MAFALLIVLSNSVHSMSRLTTAFSGYYVVRTQIFNKFNIKKKKKIEFT